MRSKMKEYAIAVLYFGAMTILATYLTSCSTPHYASSNHYNVNACPTWAQR